jgi:hypothetical protein
VTGDATAEAIVADLRRFSRIDGWAVSKDGTSVVVRMSRFDAVPMTVTVPLACGVLSAEDRASFLVRAHHDALEQAGPIRIPHGWPPPRARRGDRLRTWLKRASGRLGSPTSRRR